jgi:predicted Zn-dependent protease
MPKDKGRYSRRDIFRGAFLGISKAAGRDIQAEQERKDAEEELLAARSALARSDCAAAEPHLQAFLRTNQTRFDVRSLYAQCLYQLGKYIQSRVELLRMTRSGHADERILALLALAQLRTGQKDRARETLRSAASKDPLWDAFFSTALQRIEQSAAADPAALEALLPEAPEGAVST